MQTLIDHPQNLSQTAPKESLSVWARRERQESFLLAQASAERRLLLLFQEHPEWGLPEAQILAALREP